jgi:hypothetical protein
MGIDYGNEGDNLMGMVKIIAHRGYCTDDSVGLNRPENRLKQHTREAFEQAFIGGFGIEADVMPGLLNGVSALAVTAVDPFDNNFEFAPGTLTFPELLKIQTATGRTDLAIAIDVKKGLIRRMLDKALAGHPGNVFAFNIESPSDDRWFKDIEATPCLARNTYRMYSDRNPLRPQQLDDAVINEARGIWLELFNENPAIMLKMLDTAFSSNKEIMIVSGDLFPWGINEHEHQESKQPYRRQWNELRSVLKELIEGDRENGLAQRPIHILTNFPKAARDHFSLR